MCSLKTHRSIPDGADGRHALWLSKLSVAVMRHGDLHLTSQRYTRTAGLAMNAAVGNLPAFDLSAGRYTQIRAQISDKMAQNVSQAGETRKKKSKLQTVANECVSRALAGLVACGQHGARCRVRTCDPIRVKDVLYH